MYLTLLSVAQWENEFISLSGAPNQVKLSFSKISEKIRVLRYFKIISSCRQMLMKTCREIKVLFTRMKDRAAKTLGFAKMLHKDLEIAAEFKVVSKMKVFIDTLHKSGHVMVGYYDWDMRH